MDSVRIRPNLLALSLLTRSTISAFPWSADSNRDRSAPPRRHDRRPICMTV
jgi:hypothetical protein